MSSVVTEKTDASAGIKKIKIFDFELEALRGIAAILVVWGHLIYQGSKVDPAYTPSGIWVYAPPTHLSVLVFFLLSGYVIGLAHAAPLSAATIPDYLKKRFLRIYPSYLVCLILALVVARVAYPATTILNHLTMTQGIFSPLITELSPAWSLGYEIIFYLLFIPISYFRINPVVIIVLSLLAGCLNAYFYPQFGAPLFSSYAFGFAFWLCGLALARYLRSPAATIRYATMASLLFLLLAVEKLDAPLALLNSLTTRLIGHDLSVSAGKLPVILFHDFAYLPYCLLLVIVFAKKQFRYMNVVIWLLMLLPAAAYYHYYRNLAHEDLNALVLPTIFYVLAIALLAFPRYFESLSRKLINRFVITGSISYGLYIVHYPILRALHDTPQFSGSLLTFSVRLVVFLLLAVTGAYLLEKKLQVWVRNTWQRPKAVTAAGATPPPAGSR